MLLLATFRHPTHPVFLLLNLKCKYVLKVEFYPYTVNPHIILHGLSDVNQLTCNFKTKFKIINIHKYNNNFV
jgi:hypothetical protein